MLARVLRLQVVALLSIGLTVAVWGCAPSEPDRRQAEEFAEPLMDEPARDEEPAAEVAQAEGEAPPSLDVPTQPDEPVMEKPQPKPEPPPPLPAAEAPLPLDNIPTAELSMPAVRFTDHHAAMNKVGLGDQFPNLELPNLQGEQKSLTELLGSKLTLVVFWNATQPTGLEELADLARYYQPRFGDKGVAIVAVNTGDQPQTASKLVETTGAAYPVLSDAEGAALESVATGKLPRTYLLDPAGKIVWFDMEYSPTTRRDLAAAIRTTLGE